MTNIETETAYVIYRFKPENVIQITHDEKAALDCVSEYAKRGKGFGVQRINIKRKAP